MANVSVLIELELGGYGLGWTDVSADLRGEPGIELSYGINGNGPTDRIASTGTLSFSLDNSTSNSGGVCGYYSPGSAVVRSGFGISIRVRLTLTDPATGTPQVRFVGAVTDISPLAGLFLEKYTSISAVDWIDEAARALSSEIAIQINQTSGAIVGVLVASIQTQPEATSIDTGRDTYAYALDTAHEKRQNIAWNEIARVTHSELGYAYMLGTGTFVWEERFSRTGGAALASFDNTMSGLEINSSREDLLSKVVATAHPRTVETSIGVLFQLLVPSGITAGATSITSCPFRDPANRASRVGAWEVTTPVSGTDYVANTQPDGTGSDITSDLSVSSVKGGSSLTYTITNNNAATAYLTTLQVRGKGLFDYDSVNAEKEDAAILAAHGEHVLSFDMPYQDDPANARNAATYILGQYGSARTINVASMSVLPSTSALLTQMCLRDISDRITVTEDVTGIASADFLIQNIAMSISPGGDFSVTWGLLPADLLSYWKLGIVGYSELGSTTYLGY